MGLTNGDGLKMGRYEELLIFLLPRGLQLWHQSLASYLNAWHHFISGTGTIFFCSFTRKKIVQLLKKYGLYTIGKLQRILATLLKLKDVPWTKYKQLLRWKYKVSKQLLQNDVYIQSWDCSEIVLRTGYYWFPNPSVSSVVYSNKYDIFPFRFMVPLDTTVLQENVAIFLRIPICCRQTK